MAWPTTGIQPSWNKSKVPLGPRAVFDGDMKYDEGYEEGFTAGQEEGGGEGGGAPSPPTSGQIWPPRR